MEWQSAADARHVQTLKDSAEGHRNAVYIQGKKVTLRRQDKRDRKRSRGKKAAITHFSKSSRRNLLDWIARIEWKDMPRGMFITLTYPDEVANVDMGKATDQRNYVIQSAERYLSAKFPTLWRKEIVPRKSGIFMTVGIQHFHLCLFTEKDIGVVKFNDWWRKAIGWKWEVQVHRIIMDGKHAAFYMAKYMTKKDEPQSILEEITYLNKPGRAWGWRRDELVKLAPVESYIGITDDEFDDISAQTKWMCPKACEWDMESFSLYGDRADKAAAIIRERLY